MQEAELKRKEEIRRKKEREEEEQYKEKKQEAEVVVKSDDREPEIIAKKQIVFKLPSLQLKEFKEIKIREGEFNKEIPEIIVSKLPFLQPKELKEIKAKIKTFFTEIIKPKRDISKISFQTKPFTGVSCKILAFNYSIEKKNINLAVPDLKTKHFDEFKTRKMNFNKEMCVSKRQVLVPRIRVTPFLGVISRKKSFIDVIPEVLHPKKEIVEKTGIEEKVNADVSGGEAEREEFELPNLFEFLLGKGVGKISEGKPICIIVEKTEEKYEELIAIMCRDIFREKIGGKPTPIYRETIEELRHEFESLVERKIMVVKQVEKSSKDLILILQGFFSQDMGFLILVSAEPLKLEEEIRKRGELSANIVTVNPQPEMEMIRDKLLKIVRGKKSIIQAESFGEEFKKSAEDLEEDLRKYKYNLNFKAPDELKYDWDRVVASSPDSNKDASDVHSAMKAFVWMYEWKRNEKQIIPQLEASGGEDVRIEEEDKNYEIETLFGVGDVRGKLTRKIKKYKDRKGEKVYFVLRNLDILRNLALFLSFKRDWRKAGYNVEFFGLDLDEEKLVPLKEFVKLVKLPIKTEGG